MLRCSHNVVRQRTVDKFRTWVYLVRTLYITARYHSSCDSYYQSGWRGSGVYVIDVDGSGPVEPTYVSCQMGIGTEGDYYGQTVVEHNLRNQTRVRGTTLPDMRIRLTYR